MRGAIIPNRTKESFVSRPMIWAFAFGAALLAADCAFAFEGRYVGGDKSYQKAITIAKRADGRFNVEAVVGMRGCSGLVRALGATEAIR